MDLLASMNQDNTVQQNNTLEGSNLSLENSSNSVGSSLAPPLDSSDHIDQQAPQQHSDADILQTSNQSVLTSTPASLYQTNSSYDASLINSNPTVISPPVMPAPLFEPEQESKPVSPVFDSDEEVTVDPTILNTDAPVDSTSNDEDINKKEGEEEDLQDVQL